MNYTIDVLKKRIKTLELEKSILHERLQELEYRVRMLEVNRNRTEDDGK